MVELAASIPPVGDYLSVGRGVVMLVLTVPWLYLAPWVQRDVRVLLIHPWMWTASVLAAGMLGLLVWLLLPSYLIGLIIYVVLTTTVYTVYILYRNGKVDVKHRVFTVDQLKSLLARKGRKQEVDVVEKVKIYSNFNKIVKLPPAEEVTEDQVTAYNLTQDLLYDMLYYRASEAVLLPVSIQQTRFQLVVDGVGSDRPPLSLAESEMVVQFLKSIGGLEVNEKRKPQTGKISVDTAAGARDVMLTAVGSPVGQRMLFRVVQEAVQTKIEELGMSPPVLKWVREKMKTPPGLILVAGTAKSGVTSTLYSILRDLDAYTRQLVTLEAKPVVDLDNITQTAYGEAANQLAMLNTIRLRDPDVIMVDRCDDSKVADMILQLAQDKLVLLGVQGGDVSVSFMALARWLKAVGNVRQAVAPLRGVICQALVRKLCTACREDDRPNPALFAKAGLPLRDSDKCYKPGENQVDEKGRPITCPSCQNSRYVGRNGVFELLEMTAEIRDLVAANASVSQLTAACRKNKMLFLQEQALDKVRQGLTSVQEVLRVTQKDKAKK